MPKYRCVVAIPTRELYSGEVDYASIPGIDGDYGVLSGHESFVGLNRAGLLTLWLDAEGKDKQTFLVSGGVTQVLNNHLSVLPRYGCTLDEIDVEEVKSDIAALELEVEEVKREYDKSDDAVLETLAENKAWFEAQLKFKGESSR